MISMVLISFPFSFEPRNPPDQTVEGKLKGVHLGPQDRFVLRVILLQMVDVGLLLRVPSDDRADTQNHYPIVSDEIK